MSDPVLPILENDARQIPRSVWKFVIGAAFLLAAGKLVRLSQSRTSPRTASALSIVLRSLLFLAFVGILSVVAIPVTVSLLYPGGWPGSGVRWPVSTWRHVAAYALWAAVLGLAFLILRKVKIGERGKCTDCGVDAMDELTVDPSGNQQVIVCRDHLLQRLEHAFRNYPHKIVMCPPRSEEGFSYVYCPVREFGEWAFSEEDRQEADNMIQKIAGRRCKVCESDASVFFITDNPYQASSEEPDVGKLSGSRGEYLCAADAFARAREQLRTYPYDLGPQGVFLPYGGDGIFYAARF